jgi:ectoine hydroxylase-related dioxygenase (phytanoyl-CoA dioxygenase family)
MAAGSVLLYDGRLLHGAGANGTGSPRLAVIIEHTVRWLRPAENHPLAVPPALVAQLPTPLQELLGYNRHSSFLGLVAGRPPAQWLHERHGAGADHSKGTAP